MTTPKAPPRTSSTAPARRRSAPRRSEPAPPATPTGVFRAHPRGFGFVDLDEPVTAPDGTVVTSCFVPPPMAKGLLSDDRVAVEHVVEPDGRATATAVSLEERVRTEVYGVVEEGLVLRLDPHLGAGRWTLEGRVEDLPVGSAVLADVTGPTTADPSDEWPDPAGAEALLERIRVRHRLALDHPAEAVAEAASVKPRRTPVARRDLRSLTTITIDSPSSRDLDDALSVYPADADGGLRVLVHISDVASVVRPGSALDAEARRAATSAYLPGWVRPMLPPQLSEDLLSLLPGVDRDALTVEMRLAPDGTVTAADVFATRICSDARLSYETAAEVLAGRRPEGVSDEVLDVLRWLRTAAARLGVQRVRRGGVEARRVEPDLTVEVVEGEAATVAATPSGPANLLIERLMVAANEAVAGWLVDRGLPGVFRVHPAPGPDAAPALEAFCAASGYHPGFGAALTPLDLAALSAQLDAAADDTASAVWDVLLGFLGRASYVPEAGDHFGLASSGYVHFTSPIRRYADLVVHRVLHLWLAGRRDPADFPDAAEMAAVCAHVNTASRSASQAENQMRKALWLAELAAADPATLYPARVTGIGPKGAFVTLDRSRVSGMLSTRELPGRGWAPTAGRAGDRRRGGSPARLRRRRDRAHHLRRLRVRPARAGAGGPEPGARAAQAHAPPAELAQRSSSVQHLALPPALTSSDRSTGTGRYPAADSSLDQPAGGRVDDDVQPVADEVQPEGPRVGLVGLDGVRVQPAHDVLAGLVEGGRVPGDVGVVERREAGVQVVVAGVDQAQRDDLDAQDARGLGVRGHLGAEAGAGEHPVADDDEVALALVDVLGLDDLDAELAQPGGEGRRLRSALRVGEAGAERPAAHDERPVRGEDHVRLPGQRRRALDDVPEPLVDVHQPLPLPQREVAVDGDVGVHPRVDRVADLEVLGSADEVPAARRGAAGRRRSGLEDGHGRSWDARRRAGPRLVPR